MTRCNSEFLSGASKAIQVSRYPGTLVPQSSLPLSIVEPISAQTTCNFILLETNDVN